jgi:hypothetical protein
MLLLRETLTILTDDMTVITVNEKLSDIDLGTQSRRSMKQDIDQYP